MSLATIVLEQIKKSYPDVTPEFLKAVTREEVEIDDPKLADAALEYALAHLLDVNTRRIEEGREGLARRLGLQ